jgi:hypothetical protein
MKSDDASPVHECQLKFSVRVIEYRLRYQRRVSSLLCVKEKRFIHSNDITDVKSLKISTDQREVR